MGLAKRGSSSKQDNKNRSVENAAKTLLANIRFMNVDDPVRTVVITSTIPNEGKTFVAANLARAMATSGIRTLIVECDMRRRSMAKTLNAHAKHGVYSVVSGEVPLAEAAIPTGVQRLHFLDAEPHIPNPSDLLSSKRFTALIEEAKKEFGYIVFDTPPVGTFVDAAVLGSKVDAVFMVVREQFTKKDEVIRATDQLRTAKVPLSGIVMNYCVRQSNEYYYEYYYRESATDGKSRSDADITEQAVPSSGEWKADETGSFTRLDVAEQPRSWSNAPDLSADDQGVGAEYEDTGELPVADNVQRRPLHSAVPPLGQTGVINREDLKR